MGGSQATHLPHDYLTGPHDLDLVVVAEEKNSVIVTGGKDFKNLENVILQDITF